ncbi:hypothetical protein BVRB_6g138020 [Beta vulgaris subsp. vulgaris]|uniref:lysM domain receptor-like kinase 4 n=1 Tax=Beta vulgaris subsp. vulgaris TaxID=3555 RepID=UPI00053F2AFF|nr:lysM domain receptor-like kinase 4 [Beta vulgaris subsp. vulgaris]KMT08519.1 hypothetical protein BVRB_6g138020 [Beta vulgaris subsp. vulgaris]
MAFQSLTYTNFILFLIYFSSLITAQQPYGNDSCPASNNATSALGYDCNGVNTTCQSFLLYRTRPPYNTISSIASLLSANASEVSAINNNISESMALATNTRVLVPVTCSCSGSFYQANATHVVQAHENYYVINNDIFGSLTTCNAIRTQKTSPNILNIFPNERLTIPLRCACPTETQLSAGIRYLLTFVILPGHSIGRIADDFGANLEQTFEANEKSENDSIIQPLTTLLIPLQNPPNGSQMEYPPYVPPPLSSPPSLPPAITPSSNVSSSRRWAYFGVGVVAGGAFVAVAGIILFFVFLRESVRQKSDPIVSSQNFEAHEKALAIANQETETESLEFLESISKIASLKVYSFKDLQAATENFSSDHWIKGSVYKGNVNGDEVAIKKMDGDVSKEISVLNKINHFNLIRLLGVCLEDGVWYFVYEFAGNGALSEWINEGKADGKTLSWGKRMQIACDVATGLNYLHCFTNPPHVHKDIKTSNVFLDQDFRAKIAKFGLSRPVRGNDGQYTLTSHIVGTKGYLAPEYLENGIVSPMLDVYAFGVLLLEMLTGKDVAYLYEGVNVNLSEVFGPVLTDEDGISNMKGFIDTSLGDDYPADIAYAMLVLVDHCLRKDPGSRPSMDEVVQIVSKTLTTSLIWGSSTSASTSSS